MISFKSKVTQKLLEYFFINPDSEHYINELAKLLELDPKNVDTKLKEFENEGLFTSEYRGRERYFKLDRAYPLLSNYREIFNKTIGVEAQLVATVNAVSGIEEAYIFGSYARDQMNASSDIDVLVIGSFDSMELIKKIMNLQKVTGREINVVNISREEFDTKKSEGDSFLAEVMKDERIKIK